MKTIALLFFIGTSLPLLAQTPVQNFILTNVADGSPVSLESYGSYSGIALIFTSNTCPYDGYYKDRITSLVDAYQGKIQFMLINSHFGPEEGENEMKAAYDKWNLSIPYLADKDQVAMEGLGARKSPEVFLLVNVKGSYRVFYGGAIDDNPQVANAVNTRYLQAAIDNLLAGGKEFVPGMRAVGCTIRKK